MIAETARSVGHEPELHGSEYALLSACVPGLGQLTQRRFIAASLQFGTVICYLAGALSAGGRHSVFLALLGNVWSVIDAYRHATD